MKLLKMLLFVLLVYAIINVGIFEEPVDYIEDAVETTQSPPVADVSQMEVHYIDVGQADATLIVCSDVAILVDAATSDSSDMLLEYIEKRGVEDVDALILTHPDADHIGGAAAVISQMEIGNIYMSSYTKDNQTYQGLIEAIEKKGYEWYIPTDSDILTLGDVSIDFVHGSLDYDDPNNASLCFVVEHGSNQFLFTGDAEEEAETKTLNNGIGADVYKVGHHGSKTSTSDDFLAEVNPTYAVISCGNGNDYGHPHAKPLNSLRSMGVEVFRTDEQGSIVATSDGNSISWNCAPSTSWKTGN